MKPSVEPVRSQLTQGPAPLPDHCQGLLRWLLTSSSGLHIRTKGFSCKIHAQAEGLEMRPFPDVLVQPSAAAEAFPWLAELRLLTGEDKSRCLAKIFSRWSVRWENLKPIPSDSLDAGKGRHTAQGVYPKHFFGKQVPRCGVGDLVSWMLALACEASACLSLSTAFYL